MHKMNNFLETPIVGKKGKKQPFKNGISNEKKSTLLKRRHTQEVLQVSFIKLSSINSFWYCYREEKRKKLAKSFHRANNINSRKVR